MQWFDTDENRFYDTVEDSKKFFDAVDYDFYVDHDVEKLNNSVGKADEFFQWYESAASPAPSYHWVDNTGGIPNISEGHEAYATWRAYV